MKNLKYIFLMLLSVAVFTSCEFDPLEDEDGLAGIETGNPFVRFAPGQSNPTSGTESGTVSLTVEFTFPVETNITVDYTLGGSATFGEDYTIAGASASGGSVTLEFDRETTGTTTATIDIQLLVDGELDGGEDIVVTLSAARADNGTPIEAGQGSLNKELTVLINDGNIVQFAANTPDFSILVEAVVAAGLDGALAGAGPFTVFAPTNAAFEALLAGNPDWNSLEDIPADVLEAVLLYHVAEGAVLSTDLMDGMVVTTLSGETFTIDLSGAPKIIANQNEANIVITDVQVSNGVIHAIDTVILP